MGISAGPDVIQKGLILCLDAGDKNSYPGSGTTWKDISGRNNNGTLINGPTFSSANGGGIVFDGTNDYVNVGDISYNRTTFSIFTWINFPAYHTNWRSSAVAKWYTGGSNGAGNEWFVGVNGVSGPSPLVASVQYGSGGSAYISVEGTANYVLNRWYYLGFTWNSGTLKLYVDSNEQGSTTIVNTTVQTTTQPLALASFYNLSSYMSTIKINITQMYNRALTADEILQNYNAQKSRFGLK